MDLDNLAELLGKSKEEVIEMLKKDNVIELKLTDRKQKETKDKGAIEAC